MVYNNYNIVLLRPVWGLCASECEGSKWSACYFSSCCGEKFRDTCPVMRSSQTTEQVSHIPRLPMGEMGILQGQTAHGRATGQSPWGCPPMEAPHPTSTGESPISMRGIPHEHEGNPIMRLKLKSRFRCMKNVSDIHCNALGHIAHDVQVKVSTFEYTYSRMRNTEGILIFAYNA